MVFLKGVRNRIGSLLLKRKIIKLKRRKQFINLSDIHTVGIIFYPADSKVFESVNSFVKKLISDGKEVVSIGYINAKSIPDSFVLRQGFHFFCQKDLNWYGKPEMTAIDDFINREFDLLVNLSLDTIFAIDYIYALSKAKLKAGRYIEGSGYSDLSIDIKTSNDTGYLAEQLLNYLNIINRK